jgi:hypothetical protein
MKHQPVRLFQILKNLVRRIKIAQQQRIQQPWDQRRRKTATRGMPGQALAQVIGCKGFIVRAAA